MSDLHSALKVLQFEDGEIDLYLYLLQHGAHPVGTLAKRLGVPRTTLYTMLSRLHARHLVRESRGKGLKLFSAETPDSISQLYASRASELEAGRLAFSSLLPKLRAQHRVGVAVPRLKVFEGKAGLQDVLVDMLQYAELESCAVWPIRKMIEVLSPEFFQFHNRERITRNIYTRAIWPQAESVKLPDYPFLGSGKEFKREIRIAPAEIQFTLGYWIYADKVAFLSSVVEGYGFIIQSEELVQTLKSQFEVLWNLSEKVSFDVRVAAPFLKTLKSGDE